MSFSHLKTIISHACVVALFLSFCTFSVGQEREIIKIPQRLRAESQARAEISIPSDQRNSDFENFEQRITALWFKRKAFLQVNRLQDAEHQMEILKSFCQEQDIKSIPFLSRALTFEGIGYLKEGNFEKAKNSFEWAEYFDPLLPQPRFELAKTYFRGGEGIIRSAGTFFKAIPIYFRDSWNDLIIVRDVSLLMLVGVLLTFLFFSTFFAIKYNKSLRHEVSEYMSGFIGEKFLWIAGWCVFFAPLITIIGALFIFLYWPIIMFRYMTKKEKYICSILLIILFFSVPVFSAIRSLSDIAVNEDIKIIMGSRSDEYDPEKIISLREKLKDNPEDPLYHFLIAGHYKKGGFYTEAYNHYLACLKYDARSYKTMNNIGNIFFKVEEYPQAVVYYKKALDVKPDFALAYYNMSIAQSENFHFKDSEESLARALSQDPTQIGKLVTRTKGKARADVVDAAIESSEIWREALAGKSNIFEGFDAKNGRNSADIMLFLNPLSVISLISIVLIILLSFLKKPTVAVCVRCGKAFCKRCGFYKDNSTHCTQCIHLFIKRDGLEPDAKVKKMITIAQYEDRKNRILLFSSIFFPGSAQNMEGKAFISALITFIWMTGFSWILLKSSLLGSSEPGSNPLGSIMNVFMILFMIAAWFVGNKKIILRKG